MSLICGECGHEIPPGMDFCPACGCMVDKAVHHGDYDLTAECPDCGGPLHPGDSFCGSCGAKVSVSSTVYEAPRSGNRGNIAILMALIPGFFNIFGLGHLVMRKYSRGAMFLVMSLVLWYLNGWKLYGDSMFLMILDVAIYFYQAMDLLRITYTEGLR